MNPADTAQQADQAYQAESIRLAELRLHQIHDSISAIEKKAALLIIGCATLLGFLLLTNPPVSDNPRGILHGIAEFLRLASFFLLVISIFLGEKAINLASVAATGLKPDASMHFAMHYDRREHSAMRAQFLLGEYMKGIQQTGQVQRAKVEELKSARDWLFVAFFSIMLRAFIVYYIL